MMERKKDISPWTVARKSVSADVVFGEGGGIDIEGGEDFK